VESRRRELLDASRSLGGVLFALGAVVLLTRQSGHGSVADFACTIVVVATAIALYAISATAPAPDTRGQAWRAVLAVTSLLLVPVALIQLLHWLGANTANGLWQAVAFVAAATLAAHSARRTKTQYAALLAALFALTAWLLLATKLIQPSAETTKWLLIVAAVALLAAAFALDRRGSLAAREVATVGGLAAVLPGVIGILVSLFAGVSARLSSVLAPSSAPANHISGFETHGWDVYLIVASISLVWLAARGRSRGLGYAGGIGIFLFIASVGLQITHAERANGVEKGIGGWPLTLIVIGGIALVLPALARPRPVSDPPASG
jgi:hypothetical protein